MTDTPETDAENKRITESWSHNAGDYCKMLEFARKLERERDDLREIFPKILEALESGACAATCSVDFLREIPREVKLVRQRLERERDEAVRSCHIWQKGHSDIVAERDRLLGICEFGIPSSRDRLLELLTETQND